jgi:hypothetical protein
MNARNLSILAILTLIVVIAAVVLTQPKTATTDQTTLFPDLMSNLDDVTEINVITKDNTVTLVRNEEGQWGLKEKHNYPVEVNKIHNLLLGAADLKILEAKTSNPELYAKIGVTDVSKPGAESTQLTFKKTGDETVASVIVGNDRIAKVDSTRREIYVRKPDEKQTWLTLGQLAFEKNSKDWLADEIVHIDSDDIRQVELIQPAGEKVLIFKDHPKDKDYQLADLPDNAKVKYAYTLRNMATTLSHLKLDDVTVDSEIPFNDEASNRAVFTTFDGLEVTITITQKEDKHYAKLVATFNPDNVWVEPPKEAAEKAEKEADEKADEEDKADEKPKVDAKTLAETLNARFNGWVYELAKYKVDNLVQKREELIEVETPIEDSIDGEETTLDLPPIDLGTDLDLPIPFMTPIGTPSTTTDTVIETP